MNLTDCNQFSYHLLRIADAPSLQVHSSMPTGQSETLKRAGTSKFLLVSVAIVALVGVWLKRQLLPTHRYLPWHQTFYWLQFLRIYDRQASEYGLDGGDCQAKLLNTTYGQTHVFACGSKDRQPVVFFHGGALNALMYGKWILPKLQSSRYVVAVDYPCDTGRSIPADSDPNNCPQTTEAIADWARQILEHRDLGLRGRASLVGYSYGALISFLAARHHPHLVDKLALLAPACIFEELDPGFLWRALVLALFRSRYAHNWFFRWLSPDPHFDLWRTVPHEMSEQLDAGRELAATLFAVPAQAFPQDILSLVAKDHPTFLALGDHENIVKNLTLGIERAHRAGVQDIKVYPQAGHLLFLEVPEELERDVVVFLTN